MLVEISCDKFKKNNGELRNPIVFHNGLNVIAGGNAIENSIGKSTLLQIIDFVFGGEIYVESESAKYIGEHTIKFKFQFGNDFFYFSRNTAKKDEISECNEKYEISKVIKLDEYKSFLLEKYGLDKSKLSFRSFVGVFSRISNKGMNYKSDVLNAFPKESTAEAIKRIEKIMEKYSSIENFENELKIAKKKSDAFKTVRNENLIESSIKSEKELKSKQEELEKLIEEKDFLLNGNSIENIEEELFENDKAISVCNNIKSIKRSRTITASRLDFIKRNLEGENFMPSSTISKLTEFFPSANLEKIEKIESFHKKLSEILKIEFEEEQNVLQQKVNALDNRLRELESEQDKIGSPDKFIKNQYEKIEDLQKKISEIEREIKSYNDFKLLQSESKTAETKKINEELKILKEIENCINPKIKEFSEFISLNLKSPKLALKNGKNYSLKTDGDDGDGTSQKNTILFDLAVLTLSKLPILIHDTVLFKELEKTIYGKIIEIYNSQTEKQIFIAIDEISSYSVNCQNIINKNTVLILGRNNELFGESFSRKN